MRIHSVKTIYSYFLSIADSFCGFLLRNKTYERALKLLAWLAILVLVAHSLRNASVYSQDFQWSGARALLQGDNPYGSYLNTNSRSVFIKSQAPNYLQLYYLMLLPFAPLSERIANITWGICNVIMLFASAWILLDLMKVSMLPQWRYILIMLFALTGFPARNAIGNGQSSIFVLFSISLGFWFLQNNKLVLPPAWQRIIGASIFGISYIKYSFAPVFGLFLLFASSLPIALASLLPSAIGACSFLVLFKDISILSGPFVVSSQTMQGSYGIGDLLSLINAFLGGMSSYQFKLIGYSLVALTIYAIWWFRNYEPRRFFAIAALLSLMFVTHLGYDYVFLIILLAFAFSRYATSQDRLAIAINYIWIAYALRFLLYLGHKLTSPLLISITFSFNAMLLFVLSRPASDKRTFAAPLSF